MTSSYYPVIETEVLSGVPVYVCKLDHVKDVFQLCVFIHAGSLHEPEGKEGLAHFFEHVPFRGIPSFETTEEVWKARELFFPTGGMNAFTGREIICFHGRVIRARKNKAINFLRELSFLSLVEESSVNKERKVIKGEFNGKYQTTFDFEVEREQWENIYGDHPFARLLSPLGNPHSLKNVTRDDLLEFKKRFFNLSNIEVVAIGDIGQNEIQEVIGVLLRDVNISQGVRTKYLTPKKEWSMPSRQIEFISHQELVGLEKSQRFSTRISVMAGYPRVLNRVESVFLSSFFRFLLFTEIRLKLNATYHIDISFNDFCDHGLMDLDILIDSQKEKEVMEAIKKTFLFFSKGNKKIIELFDQIKEKGAVDWKAEEMKIDLIFRLMVHNLLRRNIKQIGTLLDDFKSLDFDRLSVFIGQNIIPNMSWMIIRP